MKRITRTSILLLSILLVATSCRLPVPTATQPEVQREASRKAWWREVVFYEIFVRSYVDSNGDGIGDFNGITSKLDYLHSLGIGGIWLMPIHPSPSYHGYEVTDYYAVNSEYGTLDDFKRLLDEAHKRNIHIILDLVLNHTSSQHPFFTSAQDPISPYRDWYTWADMPQSWGKWHETSSGFYYGYFCDCMPDLNYANPNVTAEMEKVARFWLTDVGVDGFRLDAAKHLFEADGKIENVPATHAWFAEFYRDYKATNPEAYTVGEIYGAGAFVATTYESQMDHIFNFELASGFMNSANAGVTSAVNSAYQFSLSDLPDGDYATFLTNHDQNRVMTTLNGDVGKAKVAAALLLTAPGTPFIYYGEEIGMSGEKPDELIRTPMQWNTDMNAGFTANAPWEAVNSDFEQGVNLAAQENDPSSLLFHYRALIQLRNAHSALRTGAASLPASGNPAIFALLRFSESETILVLINLSDEPVGDYTLDLKGVEGQILLPLMGMKNDGISLSAKPVNELAPRSVFIFQVK